jgi:hypothetical protein
MGLTLISKDELAARGALSVLQDYKQAIADLYKSYPKLLKIEQEEKRKATMLRKYGTLNPTKAQMTAKAEAAASVAGTEGVAKPKGKSHKKGQGKKALQAVQAAQTNAAVDAATGSAIGDQTGSQVGPAVGPAAEAESMEITEGEPVGAGAQG